MLRNQVVDQDRIAVCTASLLLDTFEIDFLTDFRRLILLLGLVIRWDEIER